MEQTDFIPGFESRHQRDISECARRIGSDPEALAWAMKRAGLDLLTQLADDLIGAKTATEAKLALSVFVTSYARTEQ